MHRYFYHWQLKPREGLRVDVEVAAGSALHARRVVEGFLADHAATAWTLESVSRGMRVLEVEPAIESPAQRRARVQPIFVDRPPIVGDEVSPTLLAM
jgi:hypothetical protein